MKTLFTTLLLLLFSLSAYCQTDTSEMDEQTYRILQNDGTEIIGKILKKDAREILILTTDGREILVPQYVVKKIEAVSNTDFNAKGVYVGEDKFASRYFLTTNGLNIKKGEHYVQWNLFGPDVQFAVTDNLGVGAMTSWIGIPLIGTIKYSKEIDDNTHVAVGALVGFGSWLAPDIGGALPYGTLSFGNRTKNIAFTGGYGAVWVDGFTEGRALASVAGMAKISSKVSFVFDSFILLPGGERTVYDWDYLTGVGSSYTEPRPGFAVLVPGLRWHQSEGTAFQFGFAGILADGEAIPVPIPMVQWFRSL